jgi:hypothetical protein
MTEPHRLVLIALSLVSCRARSESEELIVMRTRSVSVPANDPSELCNDVRDARVCWSAKAGEGVWVAERPLPAPASDPAKYRCTGLGHGRECRLRSELAPRFRCRGARCTQVLPRVPDDGEWECADLGGAVLCRGGAAPAGVARPSHDPGWRCGARRQSSAAERVCLDLDPDYPNARSKSFRCRYELEGAKLTRSCESSNEPLLGLRCRSQAECPVDASCISGICLPPSLTPNCWGALDCAADERCVYGSCTPRPP